LQKTTALSRCKVEYIALKEAIKGFIYLINVYKQLNVNAILKQLNYRVDIKFYLFLDSMLAIDLANNPKNFAKIKHIDIQYYFMRKRIQEGTISLNYISTKEQLANILIKGLNPSLFKVNFNNLQLKK
jgi:hypothetical protein